MRSRLLFSTICLVLYCGVAAAQVPGAGITLLASNGGIYGTYENTLYDLGANGGTTTLNTNDGGLSLCLETPGGLLLGTSTSTSGSLQLVAVTLTGAITPIAQLPSGTQTAPCPAMASDGNYYGSGFPGGTYGNGYLYQLTSAGALNVFYNFVNRATVRRRFIRPFRLAMAICILLEAMRTPCCNTAQQLDCPCDKQAQKAPRQWRARMAHFTIPTDLRILA